MFPLTYCGFSHAQCWSRAADPTAPLAPAGISFFDRAAIRDRHRPDPLARAIKGPNAFALWLRCGWSDFAISESGGSR